MDINIFNKVIQRLSSSEDKEGQKLNMDATVIAAGNDIYSHFFFGNDAPHLLRSVCKCILSLCAGIAIEEKTMVNGMPLSLDTLIWDTLKIEVNLTNKENLARLEKLTLWHLLTHTVGFEDKLLKSKDIKEIDPFTYLEMVVNHPIMRDPGEFFLYSNAAPYMLSAFMQLITGMNVSAYARNKIMEPMEIYDFEWTDYGKYCAGCTGLKMKITDLVKIGKLMLQNGVWNEKNIVSESWIVQMTNPQVLTPEMFEGKRAFPKYAYGLLMWICDNGTYYCDGTDGQYLIVVPNKQLIIATTARQPDMKPITECFRPAL